MPQHLTILFSDIANSTSLYQTHGDAEAHQRVTGCLKELRAIVEKHQGKLLRTVGDAVLSSFDHPDSAFEAAVDMQLHHHQSPLSLRVGFHHGEVIPDAGDVYGNAVNIAARVASFANASEIYTTQVTVDELSPNNRNRTKYLDEVDFKGIDTPLGVSRIHWAPGGSADEDTQIVTAVSPRQKYKVDIAIALLFGAEQYRVDPDNPVLNLGRSLTNDIVVNHDSTSRNHARIELVRGKYMISDSSTNGTYIVRSGQSTLFVRRESIVLGRLGAIGLGWSPEKDDIQRINFKSVKIEPLVSEVILPEPA